MGLQVNNHAVNCFKKFEFNCGTLDKVVLLRKHWNSSARIFFLVARAVK